MTRPAAPLVVLWLALAPGLAAQEVTLVLPPEAEDLRDLLESASLTISTAAGESPAAQDVVAAARADYRQLLTGLYAAGHYGGTISILLDGREAAAIQPLDAPDRIGQVEIRVEPGPVFTFGTVGLAPLAPDTVLPRGFTPGETAASETIRAAVLAGVDAWRNDGHALAQAAGQDIRAQHPRAVLDVSVTLDPGPRLRFGPLTVEGNAAVRTERVIAIAGLPEGRVFSPQLLDLAATRLRRSGAFEAVALTQGEAILPPDLLPMTATVSEMVPRRLGFGALITSTEGVTLSAFWLHRNLLGGAERFRVGGEISGIAGQAGGPDVGITLEFARPATFGADTDLTANLALTYEDEADYRLWQVEGDLGLIRYTTRDLTYEAGLGFLTAREETGFRSRDYTLLTLPLSASLDRRNDPFDATAGYALDLDLTPFLGIAGGDSGLRLFLDARGYRSFGAEDRVTLAARGQIGSVVGADLLDTPADFLFYSGGGGTVRGQPYHDLGISLARIFGEGARIGGASFAGAQIEARVRFTESLSGVVFYDVGIIDDAAFPQSDADWHAGTGIGVRYATPIGPIRLDLGTPASGDDAFGSLQIYLGIGQAF